MHRARMASPMRRMLIGAAASCAGFPQRTRPRSRHWELHQDAVAAQLDETPAMLGDLRFDKLCPMGLQRRKRCGLIGSHEAAVAHDVRSQYGSQTGFHASSPKRSSWVYLSMWRTVAGERRGDGLHPAMRTSESLPMPKMPRSIKSPRWNDRRSGIGATPIQVFCSPRPRVAGAPGRIRRRFCVRTDHETAWHRGRADRLQPVRGARRVRPSGDARLCHRRGDIGRPRRILVQRSADQPRSGRAFARQRRAPNRPVSHDGPRQRQFNEARPLDPHHPVLHPVRHGAPAGAEAGSAGRRSK